ncbi:MAG: hypothetical protein V3W20_06875, partial [Candidatus Neomarinimicrobiota bacterium]
MSFSEEKQDDFQDSGDETSESDRNDSEDSKDETSDSDQTDSQGSGDETFEHKPTIKSKFYSEYSEIEKIQLDETKPKENKDFDSDADNISKVLFPPRDKNNSKKHSERSDIDDEDESPKKYFLEKLEDGNEDAERLEQECVKKYHGNSCHEWVFDSTQIVSWHDVNASYMQKNPQEQLTLTKNRIR